MSPDDGHCSCWFGPAVLHSGHCCFRDDQVGPVFCHRVSVEAFPDAPAGDMPASLNSEFGVQLALLPAPVPAPFAFVEQPVQDVLRLARPVRTLATVGELL